MYRPGNQNAAADALSRKEQDTGPQTETKNELKSRVLLHPDQLDPQLLQMINQLPDETVLALLEFPEAKKGLDLIAKLLDLNKNSVILELLREEAKENKESFYTLRTDGLLLFKGRFLVPDLQDLRTRLIQKAYDQVSTAHLGRIKTYALLKP